MNAWISIVGTALVVWLLSGCIAFAGKPRRSTRNRAETSTSLLASPYQQEKHGIMLYTLLLVAFAIAFHLIEWQTYINKPDLEDVHFAEQNQYYFMIAMIGFGGAAAVQIRGFIAPEWVFELPRVGKKSKNATQLFFNRSAFAKQFFVGLFMLVGVQLVFGVILRPFFGTVSDVEKSIFYFTGAVSEELFYRLLIQHTIASVLRKIPVKAFKNAFLSGFIAVIPASIYFMSQHFTAYSDEPILFLGTLFLGVAFGVIYVISQNILLPVLLHAISNFLVSLREVWGLAGLGGLSTGASIGMAQIVFAMLIITVAIVAIVTKRTNGDEEPKQDDVVKPNKPNKKAWIILGVVTIVLLLVSILLDAWGWYVPTAGAP